MSRALVRLAGRLFDQQQASRQPNPRDARASQNNLSETAAPCISITHPLGIIIAICDRSAGATAFLPSSGCRPP